MAQAPKAPNAPQNRASRENDARELTQRPKEWQPPSKQATVSHTDDYVLRWLRVEYNGQQDMTNMEKKLAEGYELISPEDPIVREKIARGELKSVNGRVERGGLVLAKIPREFANQRNAHYTEQAQLHQQSVNQALKSKQHKSMPIDVDYATSTSSSREG